MVEEKISDGKEGENLHLVRGERDRDRNSLEGDYG